MSARKAKAVAVYVRISQDRSGEALGVERQERLCRELAESKGWAVAEVYSDNDISAFGDKRRPAYQRMLTDLRDGARDAVIVLDQDRLTRHTAELEEFIALADAHGIALANVSGDLDLSTSDGRFKARIMGAVARQESEKKSDRIKRERADRASKGKPHPGMRRFGFKPGNIEHERAEAAAMRDAADRIVAGESMRSIALEWNEQGLRSARGNPWSTNSIRDLLTNPGVAGLRVHRGEVVGEGSWEPIIDRASWEQIVAMTARRKRPGRPTKTLLSGILTCSKCGAGMVAHYDRRTAGYRCHRQPTRSVTQPCGGLSITRHPTDEWVTAAVLHRLRDGLPSAIAEDGTDTGELVAELRAAEDRLSEVAAMFGAGDLDRRAYLAARKAAEDRLGKARSVLKRNERGPLAGVEGDVEQWWEAASIEQQRAVLRAVLERVDVLPVLPGPRRFNPERLVPVWIA